MTTVDTAQATLTPAPDVLFQTLGGEGVALNLASGKYYGFDDIATRMWTLLAEHGAGRPAGPLARAAPRGRPAPMSGPFPRCCPPSQTAPPAQFTGAQDF